MTGARGQRGRGPAQVCLGGDINEVGALPLVPRDMSGKNDGRCSIYVRDARDNREGPGRTAILLSRTRHSLDHVGLAAGRIGLG